MTTAFVLTFLAGASTALGGLLGIHRWVRSDAGLAAALAFAAGAMLLVSVAEILPKGAAALAPPLRPGPAWAVTLGLAALGAAAVSLLGRSVPEVDPVPGGRRRRTTTTRGRARRSGMLVALAVSAHNLPEGLVTFVTTLDDAAAGATIAVAIAVHNIPEGVAVAAPLYGAGASRPRVFGAVCLSGLAEPAGAVLGYLLLATLLPTSAFGAVFGLIAGVMIRLGLVELLPTPGCWRRCDRRSSRRWWVRA